jgi:hypothetical protein
MISELSSVNHYRIVLQFSTVLKLITECGIVLVPKSKTIFYLSIQISYNIINLTLKGKVVYFRQTLQIVIITTFWLYGPCRAFISLTMPPHSFLSCAVSLHLFILTVLKSASASSSHLSLGLPVLLLPPSSPSNSF